MWADYANRRTVATLGGLTRLNLTIRRCRNAGCPAYRRPYRPEAEGRLALPRHEFGLDVVALNALPPSDGTEAAQLLPLVYDDLRRLAGHQLAREAVGQTLDATALVHEAYLRLVGGRPESRWDGRGHFFAAAATAMRRILVESARRRRCHKHGGGLMRHALEEGEVAAPQPREGLVALDEALTALAATNRAAADLVQLRYFGGLPLPTAAEALGISPRTAARLWAYARAWLHERLTGASPERGPS
jgi:RNA polymerase sigma factor (TIGR02999 family)